MDSLTSDQPAGNPVFGLSKNQIFISGRLFIIGKVNFMLKLVAKSIVVLMLAANPVIAGEAVFDLRSPETYDASGMEAVRNLSPSDKERFIKAHKQAYMLMAFHGCQNTDWGRVFCLRKMYDGLTAMQVIELYEKDQLESLLTK